MAEVYWTDTALVGLSRIRSYIEQFNPHAAAHVATRLHAAAESLAHFPRRGRRVANAKSETRELVADYPYIIRYRVAENMVTILRVRHAARRPTKR